MFPVIFLNLDLRGFASRPSICDDDGDLRSHDYTGPSVEALGERYKRINKQLTR